MAAAVDPTSCKQPDRELVRTQVQRILASEVFVHAERISRFLRYTVEQSLEGHRDQIKESVIGVAVYDRSADYSPKTDPIVRNEARRLRAKLTEYYEGEGCLDPVLIEYPKGSYAPVFRDRQPPLPEAASPPWKFRALLAAGLVLGCAAFWLATRGNTARKEPATVRMVVLPFAGTGSGPDDDPLGDGIAEDLIARINAIDGVRAISKTSALSFRGKNLSLREIGARLNVAVVLSGTVRRSGSTIEVGARLVGLPEERELWSGIYLRPIVEVFAVQAEIAASVAAELRLKPVATPRKWPTNNPEAYALYLRGRSACEPVTRGGSAAGLKYFESAATLDPGYAQAFAGMADAYANLAYTGVLVPRQAYLKATEAAERALALDESLPEAHQAAAIIKMRFERDWRGAERSYLRAIELDPNNATARERYGVFLSLEGRFEESLDQGRLAQSLDPLSPHIRFLLANTLYYARRYPEAVDECRQTLELDPNYGWAHHTLGRCFEQMGNLDEAVAEFLRSGLGGGNLGHAYAVAGRTGEARGLLATLEKEFRERGVNAGHIAVVYAGLGDSDRALAWLEKAREQGDWMGNLKVAPVFDRLRPDPRFAQLVQRAGFR